MLFNIPVKMKLKIKWTKLAFKVHGWAGLTAGFFFLLYGLTGSALMFRADLDRFFNPELHQLKNGIKQVSLDSIYRMVVRTHPNLKKIVLHDFPKDKFDSYEFMLYQNQQHVKDGYLYFVFVNPYTGKMIREGSYEEINPSFFRWLYSLHYTLLLGFPGKLFGAVTGIVMFLSMITGTIIYRKHFWEALRFRSGLNFKNKRTAVSSLHRIIGVWALLFNTLLFFTGFWINKSQFKPSAWKINPIIDNRLVTANIDRLVEKSRIAVKGFEPIAINIPTTNEGDVLVKGHLPSTSFFLHQGKASSISFNAKTGELIKVSDIDRQAFSDRLEWEVYQFHIGNYGGNLIRWLYVIMGLTPGLLSVTGAMLWWKKKEAKRSK